MKADTVRANLLFGVLILALGGLSARLVTLMLADRAEAVRRAARQQRHKIVLPARPGGIYARAGRRYVPLAVSRQVPGCFADPSLIDDAHLGEVADKVGRAIGIDPAEIVSAIRRRCDKRFAWLKRDITPAQARAVRQLGLRAVGVQSQWRREYPSGGLAATVLGFRRADGLAGGGVELAVDRQLAARDGRRVVLTDAARRPIWPLPAAGRAPRDGDNVFLSLDAVIEGYLREAMSDSMEKFSAEWAAGVVVDPATGAVLAMASLPSFDPNDYGRASPASMTNRAVSVPFEPGSVFKPLIAAGAVDAGVVGYQDRIFCENGRYRARRGGVITDHGKSYGYLTLTDGVVLSSNICMAKVGERLGNERLYRIVRRFGFGEQTGIDLPGQSQGIVRPLAKWDGYSMRRVPFGQEISATSLQLVMAFSALANGGLLLRPRLIDLVADADGRVVYRSSRQVVRRVISPRVAAESLSVLEQVVSRGTGRRCRMEYWRSFGKTGTAQIAGPGGYVDGAFVGSFIGGAPTSNPRLICLISIYRPDPGKGHYGATVAAPYVKDVLARSLRYLEVPPDKTDNPAVGLELASTGR